MKAVIVSLSNSIKGLHSSLSNAHSLPHKYCNFLWVMLVLWDHCQSLSGNSHSGACNFVIGEIIIYCEGTVEGAAMSHTARKAPKHVISLHQLSIIQHQRVKTIWLTCDWMIILIKCHFCGSLGKWPQYETP